MATTVASLGSWTHFTGTSWLTLAPGLKDSINPVLKVHTRERIELSLLRVKDSSFSFIV